MVLTFLLVCVLIPVFLAVAGPFGTYAVGQFGERLWFWAVLVWVSWPLGYVVRTAVTRSAIGGSIVGVLVQCVLFTVVFLPFLVFWRETAAPGVSHPEIDLMGTAIKVFTVCVVIWVGFTVVSQWRDAPERAAKTQVPPALIARLPDGFDGQILRLSGENHVVRVWTDQGTFTVRMRLRDAAQEMDGTDGLWVHRSHWVARSAIADVVEDRGRLMVHLIDNSEVPVGTTYREELEEAGVIQAGLDDYRKGTVRA